MQSDNHISELGLPIATRQLVRPGHGEPITVRVWAPRQVAEDEWVCPFQIAGLGDEKIRHAHGIDAVQALQLSFDGVRSNLQAHESGIVWMDREIGDAGFPMHVSYAFGADFYYYLCDLVDREITPDPNDLVRSKKMRRERVAEWKKSKATPSGHSS